MDVKIPLEQQPMVKHRAIVCQGTNCYRSQDSKIVAKLSWLGYLRPPEAENLRRVHDSGATGVAALFGHNDITGVQDMREGLMFPSPYRFRCTPLSTSTSFSESQSQATLSRSFGAFQSLGISQNSLGNRKSVGCCRCLGKGGGWSRGRGQGEMLRPGGQRGCHHMNRQPKLLKDSPGGTRHLFPLTAYGRPATGLMRWLGLDSSFLYFSVPGGGKETIELHRKRESCTPMTREYDSRQDNLHYTLEIQR